MPGYAITLCAWNQAHRWLSGFFTILLAHAITPIPLSFQGFIRKVRMMTIGRRCAFDTSIHSCFPGQGWRNLMQGLERFRYNSVQTNEIKRALH